MQLPAAIYSSRHPETTPVTPRKLTPRLTFPIASSLDYRLGLLFVGPLVVLDVSRSLCGRLAYSACCGYLQYG